MFFPTGIVALLLALVSGYALTQSLQSISNVKKYEAKAEQAAEWSNTAKKRLWDTRYTLGTGLVSCLISLLSAIAYLLFVPSSGGTFVAFLGRTLWPALLAALLRLGTARYMRDFWATKAKMPLLDQYNTAISQSMQVIELVDALAVGWVIMTGLKMLGL